MTDAIREFLQLRQVADHVIEGGMDGLVEAWERAAKWLGETDEPDEFELLIDGLVRIGRWN